MQTKTEDVYVTKLVGLVTRIQNIWICIFLSFLQISKYFRSLQLLSSIVPIVFTLGPLEDFES